MRRIFSASSVRPSTAAPPAGDAHRRCEQRRVSRDSPRATLGINGSAPPTLHDLPTDVHSNSAQSGVIRSAVATVTGPSLPRALTQQLRQALGARGARVRRGSVIRILENDIVAQNYRHLEPIQLVESGHDLVPLRPPRDTHPLTATLGILLLFVALAITSSPLAFGAIATESVSDNSGLLVKKNASYAKAYFLGKGFLSEFVKKMNDTSSAVNWFPQPTDTTFLNFSYMNPSTFAAYGMGACALLDPDPANPIDCILMTGHQGGVSSYGLCRNGTEYIAMHYVTALVTPHDVAMPSGPWIENTREVIFTGLKNPPTCVDGKKIVVYPDVYDRRLMSGAFAASTRGVTDQWLDVLSLPKSVRERMFYLIGKSGNNRLGLTLPTKKRQSFDQVISQDIYGSTLADLMEFQEPFTGSKHVFISLYRLAGAGITLPRLQFTSAVAVQTLSLLIFMLTLTIRNGPVRTYHLVVQVMRLPMFSIISIQLLYVLYYQIFSIAYLVMNPSLRFVFETKVVYVAGITFILMHQMDVRTAVTLWPRMANNDSYYAARLAWMLGSLGLVLWSLNKPDPDHFVVTAQPDCALAAMECNVTKTVYFQHWICLGIIMNYLIAYGILQIIQLYRNPEDYRGRKSRHPDFVTSFEAYACGRSLPLYYYYNTLVTKAIERPTDRNNDSTPTLQYLTCAKAVRDEGFVLLGGCNVLIRVKDLYLFMLMKLVPRGFAGILNWSVVIAHIVDSRMTPMRRVSYEALWTVAHRWDGRLSYPDIG